VTAKKIPSKTAPADSTNPVSQAAFLADIDANKNHRDLLLVKVLLINIPIIEVEFGADEALQAMGDLSGALSKLSGAAAVFQISPLLMAIRALDASNPPHFLRQVKSVVDDINVSGRHRFLLETSIGAVVTEHASELRAQDWVARLNLAVLKSTRTGRPELADHGVATSEQVRRELSRLVPGSAPPEGMYWVYQPINYAADGRLFGYETLCRWDSPTLGPIEPSVFVQIAEDLNLVQILDFWTLKAVEADYPELVRRGGQAISVNISAQTLGNDHEFYAAVDRLLPHIKEAHFSLIFELTETSVIENQIDLQMGLASLRKRGAKIAIDDFGTGLTSLSTISGLPTDFVKLDGSLLEVERPDLSRGLLDIGVRFAALVGADVIVEKVETQADLDLANEVGAKFVQGWLFGQPVDLREPEASAG
jgi:EAL domain-containing protein (putative c-di-GMP-specific phosphodiesterase class I)